MDGRPRLRHRTPPRGADPLESPLEYELRELEPPSTARVTAELEDGRFTIATEQPHVKVAWQVTAATTIPGPRDPAPRVGSVPRRGDEGDDPRLLRRGEGGEDCAREPRRFVAGFLGSFVAVLAVVLAFNVVVDPLALAGTGIVPTAVEPDRSIKLDLIQHLKREPADPDPGRFARPAGAALLAGAA